MSDILDVNKDFGRTDYWAPDSSLDTDINNPGINYLLSDNTFINIKPNDWLDLDETFIVEDPLWGYSFQVIEPQDGQIVIRFYNKELDIYEPLAISPELILNNYRRVPRN